MPVKNFYPRSPCGERRVYWYSYASTPEISIHALLAESDQAGLQGHTAPTPFLSTLSLRRATHVTRPSGWISTIFLSTLSLRRATHGRQRKHDRHHHFYPRSPCGERPDDLLAMDTGANISIHALLAESDGDAPVHETGRERFLSTLSLRRATDCKQAARFRVVDFYPRSPCGERLALAIRGLVAPVISIHALLAESD